MMDRQTEGVLRFQTDLNWLRLFCIVSIFLMHTGLSFSYIPQLFDHWYFQSRQANLLLTGFCSFANSACMPLFFFLAGISAQQKLIDEQSLYFIQRIGKWSCIIIVAFPVTSMFVISPLLWFKNLQFNFSELLFPRQIDSELRLGIPFNLFHLWFLVVLLLIELLMTKLHRHLQNKINSVLIFVVVVAIQTVVILIQDRGYLLTPVVVNVKTGLSLLVYCSWYLAGYWISIPHGLQSIDNLRNRGFIGVLGIVIYFITKYIMLKQKYNELIWGLKLLEIMFDAMLPISVILVWSNLIQQPLIRSSVLRHPMLNSFRKYVIRRGVWIYLIQIPLIFWLLSVGKKYNLGNLIILGLEPLPALSESSVGIIHWLVLSGTTILSIVLSFQLVGALKKLLS